MLFAELVEGTVREGVGVWLKMDDERYADERGPWTVLVRTGLLVSLTYDGSWRLAVNGPDVGSFPTLDDCLISADALA
ncbi:hypothetical protein C8D87_1021012 [Lentzea atacamensis]|uniref:Uncharacterized protein n=1 Tax=Lentzea atacamensis TaxID=531938 RepID=A0ABX9EIC2_9PSEU|nr:hypothetical protein [Lentzea atacamensis]RAS68934.1 hypothetical protein C8D87_1021012 [Lentzea atacamensis]